MNSKAYLPLFRTIRNLQLCDSVVGTWIPALMTQKYSSKTYCLLKDAGQHVNKCTCARTSYFSLRFLTQKTTEDGNAQLDLIQQSSKDLTDHLVGGVPSDNKFQREVNDTSRLADDEASEDLWVPSNVREESYPEIYPALRKCTSPSDVLDLCSNPPLSAKQISNCFTTMWETSKKIRSEQRRYEKQIMFEHPNFENLCYLAMNTAHRMRPEDLVYTLHAVIKLEINQRSRLVQTLLRACQENLNNFEEREISVLSSSLDGMSSSRNVDALRSGLRLLVEMRLPEIRGVLPLQTMMRAIGKDAPLSLKKKLERKALEMVDVFSIPNCQHMFSTLASISLRSFPLLDFCSQKIIDGLDDIPFWKLINVLQSCRELSYRNADLFTAIGDYIINTAYMWQTKQVTLILSMLENLGFRHIPLLDSYAEIVIQSPESLTLKDLLITVKVYSLLNHLPEGKSQQFLEALGKSLELYLPRIPQVELLRVVYSFCILGYFPHQPLDKLLQEDVLNGLLSSETYNVEINERMLHSINLCLKLDKPSIRRPDMVVLGKSTSTNLTTHPEVQTALVTILQDTNNLQQNVQLPTDYYIDFVFTLDPEQNTLISETDDCTVHGVRVAVLCPTVSSFAFGTLHPLGKLAVKMRHLRALGYKVLLVPLHEFGKLNVCERVEFLRSQIFPVKSPDDEETNMALGGRNSHNSHPGH